MNFLTKIRGLPERQRKIILWVIIVILGIVLFNFWLRNFSSKIKGVDGEALKEQLNFPDIGEKLKDLPGLSDITDIITSTTSNNNAQEQ